MFQVFKIVRIKLLKIYLYRVIIIRNELIDRNLIKKKKIEEILKTAKGLDEKNGFIIQCITQYSLRDLDELIVHDLIMIT